MAPHAAEAADLAHALVLAPTSAADWVVVAPVAIPILAGALLMLLRH